jgi:hypothetical protein
VFSRRSEPDTPALPDDEALTPEEEAAWAAGVERVAQEKRRALREPGPTWREWFFYDHAKWWYGIAALVVDSWVATSWVAGGARSTLRLVGLAVSVGWAVYLEFLLYRYLWRRPVSGSAGRFRPGWFALREVGLWTPEATHASAPSARPAPEEGAPNPREFL